MAYSSRDRQRQGRSSSRRQRTTNQYNHRSRTPSSGSRRGTLTRPDTGYSLNSRRVRREPGGTGLLSLLLRPRVLLLIGILVIVIVVMIVGITSCIRRNNEAASQTVEEVKPKNEQDARVAAGVSASMTSKFTEALDNADLLANIAKTADEYDDERLLTLALEEPDSRKFVAAYPKSDKSSRPYDEDVKRGEVPRLYNWDEHWGAVTYGDGPLAVTGSGPTTLAMAYMGLTGKTDFSPTEIAQQASKSNYTGTDSGTKSEMFSKLTSSMGLTSNEYSPALESLYSLGETTVIAVELKANTLTDYAHWALVVNINEDESVTVFDPTSTYVSTRTWGMDTIASSSSTFFTISPSESTLAELDKSSTDKTNTNSSSNGNSNSKKTSSDSDEEGSEETEDTYSESSDDYSEE